MHRLSISVFAIAITTLIFVGAVAGANFAFHVGHAHPAAVASIARWIRMLVPTALPLILALGALNYRRWRRTRDALGLPRDHARVLHAKL